jgi:hypothetical protein
LPPGRSLWKLTDKLNKADDVSKTHEAKIWT